MSKGWITDGDLVDTIAGNLCETIVYVPRQLIKVDKLVKASGMPFSHIQILILLSGGSRTIGAISTFLGIARPNITPLLDKLGSSGLTVRKRSEEDKRIMYVCLTEKGHAKIRELRNMIAAQVSEWGSRFNRSEVRRLNAAFSCIIGLLQNTDELERTEGKTERFPQDGE